MINITNHKVDGFEAAIRGMRNPMNSWELSDSRYNEYHDTYYVGTKDLELMKKLIARGPVHSKFMRFITITMDINAPLYWWKEFDTYKVGTVRNSCSTMHKIQAKEFTLDDFSHEHLLTAVPGNVSFDAPVLTAINVDGEECYYSPKGLLSMTCDVLNHYRDLFLKTRDKVYWWQMIQLLPSSYNQKATVHLNYEVLRNMYHNRKNHKLDEWKKFCEWIEETPYSELITDAFKENE